MEQVRQRDPTYQIGSGKVKELTDLVGEKQADKVIFDNELKPLQSYNLAKETGVEARSTTAEKAETRREHADCQV